MSRRFDSAFATWLVITVALLVVFGATAFAGWLLGYQIFVPGIVVNTAACGAITTWLIFGG